ncbi:hypothetical protein Taro_031920 [Colocasia esculenta]|uniref:Kinesin motor domain-containing protein n=1 Tax=Colocasia esculenta TaxID=4460 RepID=A0A843VQ34_COLES|nr:hypothetical protein [Colocasia esculenta]
MLKDLRSFRRNTGRSAPPSAEANDENVDPADGSAASLAASSSRAPLNAIQDAGLMNPKLEADQEMGGRRKVERTPSKGGSLVKTLDASAMLRTPEKPPLPATPAGAARNRFGWGMRIEGGSGLGRAGEDAGFPAAGVCPLLPLGRGASSGVGGGPGLVTPRPYKAAGKASSVHSESSSTQSTPSRSVNKPLNPGFGGSRPSLGGSNRTANFVSGSRGVPMSSPVPSPVVNTVEVPHFEMKEDPSFWLDHNVQVVIRIRPLNVTERSLHGYNRCLKQENAQTIAWLGQPESRFTFDHVACETINQETLFRVVGLPMIENCMSGYNSCMFAYGQTGSGKTHTMLGEIDELDLRPSPERGMIPRIFEFLFARIKAEEESRRDENLRYSCKCSFLEIYNEQITDLLDPSSTNLLVSNIHKFFFKQLREDIRKGVYVENLSEFEVETVNDILKLLIQGAANRKIAATNMNRESSRSHSVFTCVIESRWEKDSTTNLRFARLNLVDLAGSERQKASGAEGERLKEAANINRSLSTLGHVIMVLVDVAHRKQRHIPYRDSRLTFLLQDSLGGNSKTMIIANVSPSVCCTNETLSTLKFAQRAKLIQNNAIVNEDASGDVVALQHQIQLLKEELSMLKRQNVSRSLSFRTAILHDSDCEQSEASHVEPMLKAFPRSDTDTHGYESSASVVVSRKQLKSLETVLAGALRREKMADLTINKLEAEIEHLNRLVRQREEETQGSKMMLKFREDKIHRMESLVDGLMPADSYLLEEKNSLAEEIQLLRSKVDRNPEVTRFAWENIRLLDQLRRFQDFYEEGERELLLREVSELRNELIRLLDGKPSIDENQNLTTETQPVHVRSTDSAECDAFCREELSSGFSPVECHFYEKKESMDDVTVNHAEQIVHLQLELDILKTILGEERASCAELEEKTCNESNRALRAEERILEISKHYEDAKKELRDAKSIIDALETQHLLLIAELDELKSTNPCAEFAGKQNPEVSGMKHKIGPMHDVEEDQSFKHQKHLEAETPKFSLNDLPLAAKMRMVQATTDKRQSSTMRHRDDQEFRTSHEEEMDEVRRQVEAETAEVIVCLQEEVAALRRQIENSGKNEVLSNQCLAELELEMNEVQERLHLVAQDNERLNELIELKEEQLKSLSEEWERVAYEIAEVLADGTTALDDASSHVDNIIDSLAPGVWVEEQVGRMIRAMSEKDALIGELQHYLEDARKVRCDMEWKLRSLKGATIAITEAQQQENINKERETLQLKSQISEKSSAISRLQDMVKLGEQEIKKTLILTAVAFMTVNRMCEKNSVYLDALEEKEFQVNYSDTMHLQKDAILHDQLCLNADLEKQIQSMQLQLVEYEDKITELQLRLAEEQEQVCQMECQLEKTKEDLSISVSADDLLESRKMLNELTMGVGTLYSFMSQYVEQAKKLTPGEHAVADSQKQRTASRNLIYIGILQVKNESNSHTAASLHGFSGVLGDKVNTSMNNTTTDLCRYKVEGHTSMQEHLGCGTGKSAYGRDTTTIILQNESESALDMLNMVHEQMSKLIHEKDEIKESEMQSRKMVESIAAQVVTMEKDINNREKQLELKLRELDDKMRTVFGVAKEYTACWNETKQELELEIRDAKVIAAQKTTEASNVFSKFEEAQETMREADMMVNALVASNESIKLELQRCLKVESMLTSERDALKRQVHDLHSSLDMKKEEYTDLEKKCHSYFYDLIQLRSLVLELESVIGEMQITFAKELELIAHDVQGLKSQSLHYVDLARKWLEDIWSEIIGKDCAVSVLHLCHMGIMLEIITGLNAENGFLHCGVRESNKVIADLRAHNDRAKKELEMCSILKGKLLVDINNSFSRITRKESDTRELKTKLGTLERKIMDLQLQEESMLSRSNLMGTELANLMTEFETSNINSLEKLYLKDFEVLILMSELKEKIIESELKSALISKMERENGWFNKLLLELKEKMSLLLIDNELERDVLLDREDDTIILKEKLREAHHQIEAITHDSFNIFEQLKERNDVIKEMETKMGTFEYEVQQAVFRGQELKDQIYRLQIDLEEKKAELGDFKGSHDWILKELESRNLEKQILVEKLERMTSENSKLRIDLAELEEAEGRVSTQCGVLQNERVWILEELKSKEAALQSSSCDLSVLCQEKDKLQEETDSLHVSVANVETELQKKIAEFTSLQRENEMLKHEVSEMSVEKVRAIGYSQQKGFELGVTSESIEDSHEVNHNLTDIICSLYSCIGSLQTELHLKNSNLDEVERAYSLLSQEFASKCQVQEVQTMKAIAAEQENENLKNEILSADQKREEVLTLLNVSQKRYADLLQSVDVISNAISHVLEGNIMILIDNKLQDFCKCEENVSDFLMKLDFLEVTVDGMLSENLYLQKEIIKKDEVTNGLLLDMHSLQELASLVQNQEDNTEKLTASLHSLEDELALKSHELHAAIAQSQMLESQVLGKIDMIVALESELAKETESRKLTAGENLELRAQIDAILLMKNSAGEELAEKSELLGKLEMELSEARDLLDQKKHFLEKLQDKVSKLADEREHLNSTILDLEEQLEMAYAIAEENEAIAVEARQMVESKKAYAEEKEEEVRLLERSVEELECTVNMLENKVEIVKGEAERQWFQREDLETELQELRNKMLTLQGSSDTCKITESRNDYLLRQLDEKLIELQDAQKQIDCLQKDVADKEAEACYSLHPPNTRTHIRTSTTNLTLSPFFLSCIVGCKAHIFELTMHAEAQARDNKQRIMELEIMAQQVKTESSTHPATLTSSKHEKTAAKSRGSGSPFKCIGLGLTQQINSEKDEELRARIQELEALAVSRQKEIFMLNARLAETNSMTHDAIRDLLGVKLHMTDYASLLDAHEIQKKMELAACQNEDSHEKENEIAKLKSQLNEFIEERQGWLDEISRRHTELVATRTALEKLRQREQFLTTENEMLKVQNYYFLDSFFFFGFLLKNRFSSLATHQEENNMLKMENEDLLSKLKKSEEILSRVKEELAFYRMSCGKNPNIDIDEELRLRNKLENTEEERVQLAQKLVGLCTNILKAAGITKPVPEVSPAAAEQALHQLQGRISSLECELQDMKLKVTVLQSVLHLMSKVSGEKMRLSELRGHSSPLLDHFHKEQDEEELKESDGDNLLRPWRLEPSFCGQNPVRTLFPFSPVASSYRSGTSGSHGGQGLMPAAPFVLFSLFGGNMLSLASPVSAAAPAAGRYEPSRAAPTPPALRTSPLLSRKKGPCPAQQKHCLLSIVSGHSDVSELRRTRLLPSRAVDMFASESDGSGKLNLDMAIESLRRLWSRFPEPVKSFPWMKAVIYFFQLVFDLLVTVAKYLCIPVLGLSSLSEMSYCAHERKMLVIPIPFLAGIAVAKILKETAVELSPSFKELEFPCHLLLIAVFFILLKLPGPYYPYWGRLSIPHFANGGLWSTLWFAFCYRRPHESTKINGTSEAEHQPQ